MEFAKIIKKLRRDKDMTQEALAECLSVSPQAVSRWETGTAMPDISLLSALCHLFDVTSDYLLGIDVEKKEAKIEEISNRANKYLSRGYFEEARAILEEGLKAYPNSYRLIDDMLTIALCQGHASEDKERKREYYNECITLGEKILAECTVDTIRHSAIQVLVFAYDGIGEVDKARELAESMPTIALSRECLLSRVGKGNKKHLAIQHEAYSLFDFFGIEVVSCNVQLDDGTWAYTREEQAILRDKAIALIELVYEDGNYGFQHCRLRNAHQNQARYYARIGNREKTLHHLKGAADGAIGFLEFSKTPNFTHTSLLFRGMGGGSFSTGSQSNDAKELLDLMSEPVFDFVRDDADFREIKERLTAYAGKWQVEEE